jgi:hypothetical protein
MKIHSYPLSASQLSSYASGSMYRQGGIYNDSLTGLIYPSELDRASHYLLIGTVVGVCRVVYNIMGIAACALASISLIFIRYGKNDFQRVEECFLRFGDDLARGVIEIVPVLGNALSTTIDDVRDQVLEYIEQQGKQLKETA